MMDDGFELASWFRVIAPDGEIWNETSDKEEAVESMRPGDRLKRLYKKTECEWRDEDVQGENDVS